MAKTTYYQKFNGIVLFTRKHREHDLLVKIFTRDYGKRMFFVRNGNRNNHAMRAIAFPFLQADFVGKLNQNGLSFLNDYGQVNYPKHIHSDIESVAYATYVSHLLDASMEDGEVDTHLYALYAQILDKMEAGLDPVIMTNIFEIKILAKFGVSPHLESCVICGQDQGQFDYSMQYGGLLCQRHFHRDERRLHWHPRAAHYIRLFSGIDSAAIHSIRVSQENKAFIRQAIDSLYEEYVGIHLKSRRFIDQLEKINPPLDEK